MTAQILTEAEVVRVWQSMPGGPDGWLKHFGFLQFAEAVEAAVLAKLAAMNEPVASIYVSAGGAREFDDWRVPLPEGRNELFAHPPAAQDREDAERVINAAREAMDESFEAGNNEADISIPSHLAAALSLALDEFDAALKGTP